MSAGKKDIEKRYGKEVADELMLEDVKACTGKGNNLMAFAGPDVIFKVKDRKTVVKIHLTKGYCKNVEIDEIGAEEITCIKVA